MRRELWTVSGAMCEIYLQTKTLISSLGSDYKASDNGDGVRVECHRYIYHRIMDTIMSPGCALPANHGTDMFSVTGMRALFFWFHEMLLMSCDHQIDIWEARFERKPEHRVYNRRAEPEMGNFKRILLGGEWSIWPRNIKYQPAFYYGAQVTNMWWVRNQVWMSGGCQDDVSLLVIMSTEIDSSIIFNN